MAQKTDPFIQQVWGWATGEDGWGTGMNNNLITYAFFHNRRYNGSLATTGDLPSSPTDGDAYFVTGDNTFYFRAEEVWYSTVPPVGMTFVLKTNEAVYKFTGSALILDTKSISDVTGLQAALDSKLNASQKGAVNGLAPLGADSKIPSTYLPEGGSYLGTWNATTNTPAITSGVGLNGDFYKVSVGGTTSIDGEASWSIGDEIRFNGSIWQRIPNTGGVSSVNGETGSVILSSTDVGAAPLSHVGSGGTEHINATTSVAGFMSSADKTKLNGIATNATANSTDTQLRDRATHTGTQAISTVSGLQTSLDSKQATLVSGTNIKTVNGNSLLGSGNITISGGGSSSFIGLTDSPSTYLDFANDFVRVKSDETGLEFVALGTAAFNNTEDFAPASHTHDNATTSLAGFMSAADKTKLNSFTGTFTSALETKLNGIAAGAEVNVNADWNSVSGDSQILNKPTLGSASSLNYVSSNIDTTAGRVTTVGWMGIGAVPPDINSLGGTLGGIAISVKTFRDASAISDAPNPLSTNPSIHDTVYRGSTRKLQHYYALAGDKGAYRRVQDGGTDYGSWIKYWDSGNTIELGASPSSARSALGLGSAALANVTASTTDGTLGRVLRVGDFGIGGLGPSVSDANTFLNSGFYAGSGSGALNFPGTSAFEPFLATRRSSNSAVQYNIHFSQGGGLPELYLRRTADSGATWFESKVFTSANQLDIGTSSTSARSALGLATIAASGSASDLTTGSLPIARLGLASVNAGNGLTGGGALSSVQTITLGTPSTITGSTTNSVTSTSHTHAISSASTTVAGVVQLNNTLTSTSTTQAATANAVKLVNDGLAGKVDVTTPSQLFQNIGSGSGARTINAANGIHVLATATGNTTWTFPSPASTEAHALTLELTNGGAYTMTWPSGTRWAGGVAPTLTASGTDILVFTKTGTQAWRGYLSSKDNK